MKNDLKRGLSARRLAAVIALTVTGSVLVGTMPASAATPGQICKTNQNTPLWPDPFSGWGAVVGPGTSLRIDGYGPTVGTSTTYWVHRNGERRYRWLTLRGYINQASCVW